MSALVWGCPKPVRWPIVDAAGVGAHGRRALSCPPPVPLSKPPACPRGRLWAALGGSAHRRHEEGPAPPLPRPAALGPTAGGRPTASAWPRLHELAVANVGPAAL